jgi:hypothetical protein
MQHLDATWNLHLQWKFFKVCVRSNLSKLGQITSAPEAQELNELETTLTNLYNYKEQIILNNTTSTQYTTREIDINI